MIYKSEESYAKKIKPIAKKVGLANNYLPSVLAAQCIRETGYGGFVDHSTESMINHHNHLGMKSDLINDTWEGHSVWNGKSFTKITPEWENGKQIHIRDDFRVYDSIEQCMTDFVMFMTWAKRDNGQYKYRNDVIGNPNPESTIRAVRENGYCTDPTYDKSIMNIIKKWNLTELDAGFNDSGSNTNENTIKIANKNIIDITSRNKSEVPASRGSNKISFIVCHYLGVPNKDNPDLYGGGYGGHYNIKRDGSIYLAANPKTAVVWHCGGGLQGDGGHQFYKICTNYNSIGIECGVCYTDTSAKEGDGDSDKWYFTEETQESLVWLVSKLMDEYNISFEHVIRHRDVSGKVCPNPYVKNNHTRTSWTWNEFKNNLKQYRKNGTITIPDNSSPVSKSDALTIGDRGDDVEKMQSMLIYCGYDCGEYGADGVFGVDTANALKKFQKDNKITADGEYGSESRISLETLYAKKQNPPSPTKPTPTPKHLSSFKVMTMTVGQVADTARVSGWTYDNSQSQIPCEDGKISCDRLEARALYQMGFRDQRTGGETCGTLDDYLTSHGWTKVKSKSEVKGGSIVAVRNKSQNYINHVFYVKSYNKKKDICTKYDTGSNQRIRTIQPFKNVKLVEWNDRVFVCAWNPPSWLCTGAVGKFVHDGVDYSPVFNAVYYSKMYPDVRKACGTNKKKIFKHFLEYGMAEGRQGCALFDVKAYKKRYPDLKKKYGNDLPSYYKHFCQCGFFENRIGN